MNSTSEDLKQSHISPEISTGRDDSRVAGSVESAEDIVISGISGRFPAARNMSELRENLMHKVDMIRDKSSRWIQDQPAAPHRTGRIDDVEKFDAAFFGCDFKQAHTMDPQGRMLLEHVYEAIVDAGVNPKYLKNTKTGVFIGSWFSDSEHTWIYEKHQVHGIGMIESSRAMLANRVSRWLELKGPSYIVDSACSSSLYALEHAYTALRSGLCDGALVCGANLCLRPSVSVQFSHLGVLSSDGRLKSFDNSGDGYVRSDTISVAYVQKARDAKRIYATVINIKTNSNGYSSQGITAPSRKMQSCLLKDIYEEGKILPSSVSYVEAHGTATRVGDPEEANAIASVLGSGRKGPLFIGAVKSNLGHSEAASGMAQLCKVIIACETGLIPPNLNYNEPRKDIPCLVDETLKVVTELMPWERGYVGINSFGLGGANAHVLLKSNDIEKVNGGAPQDDVPRLIVASGRSEKAVDAILTDVECRPVDAEYIRLLHGLHEEGLAGHPYRGYTIVDISKTQSKMREIKHCPDAKRPIWFVLSGIGSSWPRATFLYQFPVFVNAINKCDAALKGRGVDIHNLLHNPGGIDNIMHSFVGLVALQIALIDLLTSLSVIPDGIVGQSFGELSCAYADGSLSAEQTILAAHAIAKSLLEMKPIRAAMATVGLNYRQLEELCPSDIEVVCHDDCSSSTIVGPVQSVDAFVANLRNEGFSVQKIIHVNRAYHSSCMKEIQPKLLARLKQVIPEPKKRSARWISTSIPQSRSSSILSNLCSAEYHTNNCCSPVLFHEALAHMPRDAILLQVTPHTSPQEVLKETFNTGPTHISLIESEHENNTNVFLQAIGELYVAGCQPQLAKLYPGVKFPVSRGTPMISPLIKWNHSENWFVPGYQQRNRTTSGERLIEVSLSKEEFRFMAGHVVDGKVLLPAAGYLILVWETLCMRRGSTGLEGSILYEDVNFLNAVELSEEAKEISIMIQGSGKFEIMEGSMILATGVVRDIADNENIASPMEWEEQQEELNSNDAYKEFRIRGYGYSGSFRSIQSATLDGTRGTIQWKDNWVAFIDTMLQMKILSIDTRRLLVPIRIEKLTIDSKQHSQYIRDISHINQEFSVSVNKKRNWITSGGVQIHGVDLTTISRRRTPGNLVLETYQFVPHRDRAEIGLKEAIHLATHLCLENHQNINVKILEFVETEDKVSLDQLFAYHILGIVENIPTIQPDLNIIAAQNPFPQNELPKDIKFMELKTLTRQTSGAILAGRHLLAPENSANLADLISTLKDGGFLFTLETSIPEIIQESAKKHSLHIISEKVVNGCTFWVLRKIIPKETSMTIIQVTNDDFGWVDKLKTAQKRALRDKMQASRRILLVSDRTFENGLLGLLNCLRLEYFGDLIRTVLIHDIDAPEFSRSECIYNSQLKLDLAVNVLRSNGVWGSYRHVPLPALRPHLVPHACAIQLRTGDLSSFRWVEGPITSNSLDPSSVRIIYSALNFKDIMLATGKLRNETLIRNRKSLEGLLGCEYAGITQSGRRVMGINESHAVTNILPNCANLIWPVPDSWTLEEAATVPSAYLTCCYALYFHGKMSKGNKVLVHAGCGAVGQAAINLALSAGCEIFTTVGTVQKRMFIRRKFPQIADDHIGNSRDTSFEQLIMARTGGRGVDIILNSLTDDKLQASIRCLANGGRFLEIGKFDMLNNTAVEISAHLKGKSFHGIMVDKLFDSHQRKQKLHRLMQELLDAGTVKPLNVTIFARDDIESAFRYMAAGKHIGKVMLKIQDERLELPIPALLRYYCRADRSYVIVGGLGSFGIELTDWLVLRGARHVILVSRSPIKNGYQLMRIKLWQSYGVKVVIISGKQVSNLRDCTEVLSIATSLAPVDAIYNLAMVLKDGLFENQTPETFQECFEAKALTTKNLDTLSRRMCPQLRHFVVFSSIAAGRGNLTQTNYGMSNSVMERICEKRVAEGLPGLAIQWGVVGDAGFVADARSDDIKVVTPDTLPQKIASCLDELDGFLNQSCPITSSILVPQKKAGSRGSHSIVDTITNMMGIKDLNAVGKHTSLAELGMDSMISVEIQQTLAREFDISLTIKNIRGLDCAKLIELDARHGKR